MTSPGEAGGIFFWTGGQTLTHFCDLVYLQILEGELLDSIAWYGRDIDEIIFQQDNASCHKAKVVSDWFEGNNMEVMNWPAHSPDLNPIEYTWDHQKKGTRWTRDHFS